MFSSDAISLYMFSFGTFCTYVGRSYHRIAAEAVPSFQMEGDGESVGLLYRSFPAATEYATLILCILLLAVRLYRPMEC